MKIYIVAYERIDPYQSKVSYIAIRTGAIRHYTFATYFEAKNIPKRLPPDVVVIPAEVAKKLFEFKKGKPEEIVKRQAQRAKQKRENIEWEAIRGCIAREEYNRGWEESIERAAKRWDEIHGEGNWSSGW